MRVVGIVTKLGAQPGLYAREVIVINPQTPSDPTSPGKELLIGMGYGLFPPALLWKLATHHPPAPRPLLHTAPISEDGVLFLSRGMLNDFRDYDAPIFHGLFHTEVLLRNLIEAEGGHSELLIVDQPTANSLYRHAGGSFFNTGLHLPHPKDPAVLLPVSRFSDYIRAELQAEWVSIFEALGAKRIVITDATKATANASAGVTNPTGNVAVEMRAAYGSSSVEESTYATGSFDPVRAQTGRRWLGDHPAIKSIVEGRISGRQTSWRKSVAVDCSFGVSAEFLSLASATRGTAKIDVTYQRTYDFYVEFHPK